MTASAADAAGLSLSLRNLAVTGDPAAPGGPRPILRCERLDIAPGEAVALVGPSGAGKTTFLHAIAGLIRLSSGAAIWRDAASGRVHDLAAMGERDRDAFRRDHIGLVFQDFILFEELSPLANAAIASRFAPRGRAAEITARAHAALARLGASIEPRDVSRLSGGERQRVALARALATAPAALVADEPTASLDRASADRLIEDLLRETRGAGRTLIVASHDAAVIAAMDRVVGIVDGVAAVKAAA